MHHRPPGRSAHRIVPQQLETTLEGLTMKSSASAGRVASAVLDPRHWQGLALLTTASMNSARVFLAAWSRSQTRTVVPG
jgi:hypothetical protein